LERVEADIAALDDALIAACADAGKAAELAAKRAAAVARQEQLYAEYERLDALVLAATELSAGTMSFALCCTLWLSAMCNGLSECSSAPAGQP
jgi:hypothetical protein